MSHWPFVIAAYAATLIGTAGLLVWAYVSMLKAEAHADEVSRK